MGGETAACADGGGADAAVLPAEGSKAAVPQGVSAPGGTGGRVGERGTRAAAVVGVEAEMGVEAVPEGVSGECAMGGKGVEMDAGVGGECAMGVDADDATISYSTASKPRITWTRESYLSTTYWSESTLSL